jgi:nicotinamidase-related amidase
VKDALLVVDAINEFEHEDADKLLASFRERADGLRTALERARADGIPVIYVNDDYGRHDGDAPGLVRRASEGKGGDVVAPIAPQPGEPFLFKTRYSALDHTMLELLLEDLEVERVLLVGGATEACIVQTGIDARELDLKVTIIAGACATVDEHIEEVSLHYAEEVAGIFVVPDYAAARSPDR